MLSKQKIKNIHSLSLKKNRDADGLFLAEGRKLVGDLLPHFPCAYLAATAEWYAQNPELAPLLPPDCDVVTEAELERLSLQQTPQQVVAVMQQRHTPATLAETASHELCLMLDGVQNPGNLGTIVRLADWFGLHHVFCSPACADIYSPKTVQATMGAIARVAIHYIDLPQALQSLPTQGAIPVYGTFLDGDTLYGQKLTPNGIIIMGNEGQGISPDIAPYVTRRLYIPSYPPGSDTSESLNVATATAIVCAEFRRSL
jgi:TrmH family RNA methyltransferase